jgi:hypothetical protein
MFQGGDIAYGGRICGIKNLTAKSPLYEGFFFFYRTLIVESPLLKRVDTLLNLT